MVEHASFNHDVIHNRVEVPPCVTEQLLVIRIVHAHVVEPFHAFRHGERLVVFLRQPVVVIGDVEVPKRTPAQFSVAVLVQVRAGGDEGIGVHAKLLHPPVGSRRPQVQVIGVEHAILVRHGVSKQGVLDPLQIRGDVRALSLQGILVKTFHLAEVGVAHHELNAPACRERVDVWLIFVRIEGQQVAARDLGLGRVARPQLVDVDAVAVNANLRDQHVAAYVLVVHVEVDRLHLGRVLKPKPPAQICGESVAEQRPVIGICEKHPMLAPPHAKEVRLLVELELERMLGVSPCRVAPPADVLQREVLEVGQLGCAELTCVPFGHVEADRGAGGPVLMIRRVDHLLVLIGIDGQPKGGNAVVLRSRIGVLGNEGRLRLDFCLGKQCFRMLRVQLVISRDGLFSWIVHIKALNGGFVLGFASQFWHIFRDKLDVSRGILTSFLRCLLCPCVPGYHKQAEAYGKANQTECPHPCQTVSHGSFCHASPPFLTRPHASYLLKPHEQRNVHAPEKKGRGRNPPRPLSAK